MPETAPLFEHTPDEAWTKLIDSYDLWYDVNNHLLHSTRDLIDFMDDAEQLHADLPEIIAETALEAFTQSATATEYKENIEHLIIYNPRTRGLMRKWGMDDPLLAAQNIECFGRDMGTLTPAEALLATARNLEIAEHYATKAGDFAQGVILSGSSAWGHSFATRGKRPELGNLRSKPSDIDLLIEVTDCADLERIITIYKNSGLIDARETDRFEYFARQYKGKDPNKAQMYSLRTHTPGTEVSIHFITSDVMERIVTLTEETHIKKTVDAADTVDVAFLQDFRPNTKSNGGEGYDLHDVRGTHSTQFHPHNTAARSLDDELYGYIAESPLGAQRHENNEATYLMGVIPYFLSVHPIVLGRHTQHMTARISAMQSSIARASEGKAVSVPRLDRMTKQTRQRVLGALQLEHADTPETTA